MGINIAIDGPAGAGKSTIARMASLKLGYIYVDTGALYRTVALFVIKNGIEVSNCEGVVSLLGKFSIEIKFIEKEQHVFLNNEDVSAQIRASEISNAASVVSAIPEVRDYLFDLQLNLAKENNVIMDGRDIGTVVLPNADVKIFLSADPNERALRRFNELKLKPNHPTFEKVLQDIIERDFNDSNREIAPLKCADDAVLLDTTYLSIEDSVKELVKIINNKLS